MPQTAEAIIIGAGVMGASLAFHLTRAGMHQVLVVDKKGLCGGMTAKSGALVRMHYTNEPEARMAFASLPYFQHWSDMVGGACGFTRTGFIMTVSPDTSTERPDVAAAASTAACVLRPAARSSRSRFK